MRRTSVQPHYLQKGGDGKRSLGAYRVSNIHQVPYKLGSVFSPYSLTIIPTFRVTLKNGGKTKTVDIGFDSGMPGTHIEMPSSLARELGIVSTSEELWSDLSKTSTASVGRIEQITAVDMPGCAVAAGKVIFREDFPLLIGNDFMRDTGAKITYENGRPSIRCDGPSADANGLLVPVFPIFLVHNGKVIKGEALFDTGYTGGVSVPKYIAEALGLPNLGTITGRAHVGDVTMTVSKVDRVGIRDVAGCHLDSARVDIVPPEAPLQNVLVGEEFFKAVNGQLGYDAQGPYFSCASSPGIIARPSARVYVPAEVAQGSAWERSLPLSWILGVAAAGILGFVAYEYAVKS